VQRELLKTAQQALRAGLNRARRRKSSSPLLIVGLAAALYIVGQYWYEPDAPLPSRGAELICKISHVYDGDTVAVRCDQGKLKVRVYGIDAPEMGQQPWGEISRDMLRGLAPADRVRVRVVDTDSYGRTVAQLLYEDQDLGLTLVRQGGAVVYERYNSFQSYRTAQAEARQEQLGIWAKPGAQQKPWEWRKLNPR